MEMNENMDEFEGNPLFIFISGPYSPQDIVELSKKKEIIDNNVEKANEIALKIAIKGHYPFVPHTMMKNWEDEYDISRDMEQKICHKWLEKCDAMYFIASSVGADCERQRANVLNLPIFNKLEDIPQIRESTAYIDKLPANLEGKILTISQQALSVYLIEYQQCMESYRHTYQTIFGGVEYSLQYLLRWLLWVETNTH